MNREINNILETTRKNALKQNRQCICENCKEVAINSHLLQRNGILSSITDNGHLIEVRYIGMHKVNINSSTLFEFKQIGIKNAFSYNIFCSHHDTSLFSEIEQKKLNFDSYKTFLLLSYRANCSELRKMEITHDWYTRIQRSHKLPIEYNNEAAKYLTTNALSTNERKRYNQLLLNEIDNLNEDFVHFHFTYQFIPIYASSMCSYDDKEFISVKKLINEEVGIDDLFIHLIPYDKSLHILIGYHKNSMHTPLVNYVESWANLTFEQLQYKITDLIAARIENWGISIKLYNAISSENKKNILDYMSENADNYDISQNVPFNLFEGVDFDTL